MKERLLTKEGIIETAYAYRPNTKAVSAVVPEELLTLQSSAKARSARRNALRREFSASSKKILSTSCVWGKLTSSKNSLIAFFLM